MNMNILHSLGLRLWARAIRRTMGAELFTLRRTRIVLLAMTFNLNVYHSPFEYLVVFYLRIERDNPRSILKYLV